MGGRSAALTQFVPERVFSLVEVMTCAADGPSLGRGGSAVYLTWSGFDPPRWLSPVTFPFFFPISTQPTPPPAAALRLWPVPPPAALCQARGHDDDRRQRDAVLVRAHGALCQSTTVRRSQSLETMIAATRAETAFSLLCKRSTASASAAGMLLPLPPFSCSCVGSRRPTAWRHRRMLQPPPSSSGRAGSKRPAAWRRRQALQAPPSTRSTAVARDQPSPASCSAVGELKLLDITST